MSFTVYASALAQVVRSSGVERHLFHAGVMVRDVAIEACPVDTGTLRASHVVVMTEDADGPVCLVGTNVEYASFVHEGTIYVDPNPWLADALHSVLG